MFAGRFKRSVSDWIRKERENLYSFFCGISSSESKVRYYWKIHIDFRCQQVTEKIQLLYLLCFDLEAAELIFKNAMNYNFCLRILQIPLEIQWKCAMQVSGVA